MYSLKKNKIIRHYQRTKKVVEHGVTAMWILIGALRTAPKGLEKGTGRVGNQNERDHPD